MNSENYRVARAEKRGGGVSRYIDRMLEQSQENLRVQGVSVEVYSAIRDESIDFNATSSLIQVAEHLNCGKTVEARSEAEHIHTTTIEIIKKYYSSYDEDRELHEFIDMEFKELFGAIHRFDVKEQALEGNDYSVGDFSIMGFGEIFRAKLQVFLLSRDGINAVYVDPGTIENEAKNLRDVLDFYKGKMHEIIDKNGNNKLAIVVPGYAARLQGGINGMIGRGFTDAITGLVSLAIHDTQAYDQVVFELQKDVPGLMSTNPNDLEDGFQRVQLLDEVSIQLAKKIFGKNGANSQLLNGKTLNPHIIEALEQHDNFSVELLNPENTDGRKTVIKKEVKAEAGKVQIIASRDDVPNRYRQGLGSNRASSLYILGENLNPLAKGFINKITGLLGTIVGASYYLNDQNILVVNFADDYNPQKSEKLYTAKEKQQQALHILHTNLIESDDGTFAQVA